MRFERVIIERFGGPETLKVEKVESLPEPASNEARVKVLAAGASFTDVMIRKGFYPDVKDKPPIVPGYEVVGVIDKLGSEVSSLREGQMVADLTVIGGYSQYLCRPSQSLVPVPEGVAPNDAVCLVLPYVTAYQMLHRMVNLNKGDRILIQGASGVVGSALVQLSLLAGLVPLGTASRTKLDYVKNLGAYPFDYRDPDLVNKVKRQSDGGVRAVFDAVGYESFKHSFKMLRPGGTLIAYGFYRNVQGSGSRLNIFRTTLAVSLWDLLPNGKGSKFYSIGCLRKEHPSWYQQYLGYLFQLLRDKKIRAEVGAVMPLSDAAAAHRLIEERKLVGKIVLTPMWDDNCDVTV